MGDGVTTLDETKPMPRAPEAGQIVRVRQRQYFVEEVVPRAAGDDATLVRMSCLDDDAQGQPLEVLWEKEVDSEPITTESWQKIASKGFDPPKLFSAYLHTLQWNCVTSTDPNLFQSPFRAGIRIDAYQLEPLQKALRLPRVNLFIAGMVQKRPFSGNTRDLSADPDRSRVGAGLRESLVAVLGLQFRENRVYPRSSSQ